VSARFNSLHAPKSPFTLQNFPHRLGWRLLLFLVLCLAQGCVQPGSSPFSGLTLTGGQAKKAFQTFDATGTLPPFSKAESKGRNVAANNISSGGPGDIVTVPPRSVIRWRTRGNCLDPQLPAPRNGDKFRLVKSASLIPADLHPLYKNFIRLTKTDAEAKRHQQQIIWCLRTISDKYSSYCDRLGEAPKAVLDRAMPRGHQLIEKARKNQKQQEKTLALLRKIAPQVKLDGRNVSLVDLIDPKTAPQIMEQQLQHLINMPLNESAPDIGYEYTELAPGVFAQAVGDGPLSLVVRVANTTGDPYDFDASLFAAQPQRKAQKITLAPPDSFETNKSDDSKLPTQDAQSNIIEVRTERELVKALEFAALNKDTHITIMNDIRANAWKPVYNFSGTLDGQGHTITISSLAVTELKNKGGITGFIGGVSSGSATLKNLKVKASYDGFLMRVSHDNKSISAFGGGLVGVVLGGTLNIENCSFEGAVNIQARGDVVGGLLGIIPWDAKSVAQFFGSVAMTYASDYLLRFVGAKYSLACGGGLIGKIGSNATVKIIDSTARGSVYTWASMVSVADKSESYAGGLIGYSDSGKVYLCRSKAENTLTAKGDILNILEKRTYTGAKSGNNKNTKDSCN